MSHRNIRKVADILDHIRGNPIQRRIIGQCGTSDFRYLEHLSGAMERGIDIDFTNLTNRQKMAVHVLSYFQRRGIPFKVLLKIKEVIVWEESDGSMVFEYKLLDPRDLEARKILRAMR